MRTISFVLMISFAVILLVSCDQAHVDPGSSPDRGAQLFSNHCERCHLYTGEGGPAPGGLPAADLRQFSKTAGEIQDVIINGFGKMPSFKDSIPDSDIPLIAHYVATQIERHPPVSK